MTVTGRMLSQLLGRRVIYPRFQASDTAENAMCRIVTMITSGVREIERLDIAPATGYEQTVTLDTLGVGALDALSAIARASGLGYRIRPNVPERQLLFEVYQGRDLSVDQSLLPRVLMTDAELANPTYTWDGSLFKNYAYVKGEAKTVSVDQTAGGERREIWVDATDIAEADYESTTEYTAALTQRGADELAARPVSEAFESALQSNARGYKTQWDLGDIITVRMSAWGKTATARVAEVEEIFEAGTTSVIPVLGSPLPEKLMLGDGY